MEAIRRSEQVRSQLNLNVGLSILVLASLDEGYDEAG